ncbi:MAG TPA: hypothetical protein VF286_06020 [Acidiphilium sp.]
MFDKLKSKTEFLAVTNKDLFFALLKGRGGTAGVSASALKRIQERYQKFERFSGAVKDLQSRTCFLIVTRGSPRFAGVLHSPDGVSKGGLSYDLAKSAPAVRSGLTVFECFWSDNLFWKKFVTNVIDKNKIGDDYWQDQVEQEQSQTRATTNIGGWVNGDTWATQASRNQESRDFIAGTHRGSENIEDISSLGAINF